jgi:phage terminase small subunit
MAEPQGFRRDGPAHAGPLPLEEVAERAARLGITAERVLEEYARIAFTTLRDIAEWGPGEGGLRVKLSKDLSPAQVAAIAEIVASAKDGTIYRIKMHDKKPVLDAMARYLGLLPALKPSPNENEPADDDGGDPREVLARRVARLAAAAGVAVGNRGG